MTLRTYTRLRSLSPKRQRQQPQDAQVRREVMERAQYRCEVTLRIRAVELDRLHEWALANRQPMPAIQTGRCPRRAVEVHHVVKRSAGGPPHPDNLIAICRSCHERTDFPFRRGRLIIEPLGGGRFQCAVRYASDKWTGRA